MTILDRIVETKRAEVAKSQSSRPLRDLHAIIESLDPPRDFRAAVTPSNQDEIACIAEIKKASPSAGLIREDFDPVEIAKAYNLGGANALSVLTDERYFQGKTEFIHDVKQAVGLAVLRKDFIVEEYQVYEARAAEADALLLIAEVLDATAIASFAAIARQLGMAVLVEVHSESSLSIVLETLGTPYEGEYLLGINNRDLAIQQTDLSTMTRLTKHLPAGQKFVAESGIRTRDDVILARKAGAHAVLVGEALLRREDLAAAVRSLLGNGP